MNEVIEQAAKAGKGIVAMKVMAGGSAARSPDAPIQDEAEARRRDARRAQVGGAAIPTSTPPSRA